MRKKIHALGIDIIPLKSTVEELWEKLMLPTFDEYDFNPNEIENLRSAFFKGACAALSLQLASEVAGATHEERDKYNYRLMAEVKEAMQQFDRECNEADESRNQLN